MVRKLRLQRGWSQQQLSQMSGLSVRTIQRIEQGQTAGLESLKSLAAVFEIHVSDLQTEPDMKTDVNITEEEATAIEQVRAIKGFYSNLITYLAVIGFLFALNYFLDPSYIWAWWPALGWGIGIVFHGISAFEVFNLFGPEWEKKQIEKRLGRKL
nr:2TM domain-containing protein [Motilimonas pumila]